VRFLIIALLLFVLWAYAEITLLLFVAEHTGILPALLLTIVTGAIGVALARAQGWQLMMRVRQEMARGEMPVDSLLSGALLFVAGILLVLPGMISDVAGLLLLIPPLRHWFARRLRNRFQHKFRGRTAWIKTDGGAGGHYSSDGDVVDSYRIPTDEERPDEKRPDKKRIEGP